MTQIDTVKIVFPVVYLLDYKDMIFNTRVDKNGKIVKEYSNGLRTGLKYVKRTDYECIIEFSSKILGVDYPRLITCETIHQCLKNVVATDIVMFDVDEVYKVANVLLCHVAKHVRLSKPINDYVKWLHLLHISADYEVGPDKDDNGITYEKKRISKGAQEYFKLYDKGKEYGIRKNASFRDMLSVSDKQLHESFFDGVTKVEAELKSVSKIRQYTKLPNGVFVTLNDLLTADANPVYEMFCKIKPESTIIKDEFLRENVKEEKSKAFIFNISRQEERYFLLAKDYDFDIDKIIRHLKIKSERKATVSNDKKKFVDMIQRWKAFEADATCEVLELLQELRTAVEAQELQPEPPIIKDTSLLKTVTESGILEIRLSEQVIKDDNEFFKWFDALPIDEEIMPF